MNDKESIIAAIKGSAAVFAVTNYWEKMSAEIEIEQGKVMADASKAAGVERFFWSSLPNVSKGMKTSLKSGKWHLLIYLDRLPRRNHQCASLR